MSAVGKKGGPGIKSKHSKSNVKLTASKSSVKGGDKPKKGLEWTLPAYSIGPKPKKTIDWNEIQKKVIRRHAPEGEDIKQIRIALRELKDKKIPVHEFVTLVSPYTSDNGAELRSVLTEDITSFQKMARKVYETMTQDVSDVLMNDQVEAFKFYQERHDFMLEKMMRAINEIYEMAPDFDFEKYYTMKDIYLETLLPLPEKVVRDSDAEEIRKRQEAYHRLQWLNNEGERMSEENRRLLLRLNELKQQQEMEQLMYQEAQAQVEAKRIELENEETKMRDQLHQLNEDVERSIIENESQEVKKLNDTGIASKIRSSGTQVRRKKREMNAERPDWTTVNAQEMENTVAEEAIATQAAARPPLPGIRKMQKNNLEDSHQTSDRHTEVVEDTIVEQANVTIQKRREGPTGRRNLAPRDTWGGFR